MPPPAQARGAGTSEDPAERGAEVLVWRGLRLSPFQVRSIRAIREGRNVLVGAPTGAGKTLVAEFAIEDAVRLGRRCIYTSPIKALSNQKYRDFRDDPRAGVGILTGDVTLQPHAQVLIMTTEILRNVVLEDPRSLEDVEYVVFDEVHFLDDPERGTVWEEAMIFAPPPVRFLCLSATVENIGELGDWIRSIRPQPLEVVESSHRPVPLHHRLHLAGRGTFELRDLPRARSSLRRVRGGRSRRGRGRPDLPADARLGRPPAFHSLQGLLDALEERKQIPALVFCFSRRDCERLASANSSRRLLSAEELVRMEALQADLARLFQVDPRSACAELFARARSGVGYHHAGMLPIHKELVERLFTSGLIKMLFTTETFALGINMPARSVVFASLRKFDGVTVGYLGARDYLQMAGRAGRQGLDREGLVFSLIDEIDLREAPLERILSGRPEPVRSRFALSYSSLLHLVAALGRPRVHEAWERSLHCFQRRGKSEAARERERARQRERVEARLDFLAASDYLDEGDRLSPKGEVARRINGCEVQITELLFRGVLENLPPRQLAAVFVALSFEDRRRGGPPPGSGRALHGLRRAVDGVLEELGRRESRHGIEPGMRGADWGLTAAALGWCDGSPLEDLSALTEASPGDLVRTFRMAIQLIRQARSAVDPAWDVAERLAAARALLDRDEVDARRQLELG